MTRACEIAQTCSLWVHDSTRVKPVSRRRWSEGHVHKRCACKRGRATRIERDVRRVFGCAICATRVRKREHLNDSTALVVPLPVGSFDLRDATKGQRATSTNEVADILTTRCHLKQVDTTRAHDEFVGSRVDSSADVVDVLKTQLQRVERGAAATHTQIASTPSAAEEQRVQVGEVEVLDRDVVDFVNLSD